MTATSEEQIFGFAKPCIFLRKEGMFFQNIDFFTFYFIQNLPLRNSGSY